MIKVVQYIEAWLANPSNNSLEPESDLPAFDTPLVGFASGDDPLFQFLKDDIGADFYWTPAEAFLAAYPGVNVQPDELTVIAWILPQTKQTRLAHKKAVDLPSIEWSKARHYWEK